MLGLGLKEGPLAPIMNDHNLYPEAPTFGMPSMASPVRPPGRMFPPSFRAPEDRHNFMGEGDPRGGMNRFGSASFMRRPTPRPSYSAPQFHDQTYSTFPEDTTSFEQFPPRRPPKLAKEKEPKMYDGKRDLIDYLHYFMKLTRLNGWDYETCGLQLGTSLTGDAAEVLSTVPSYQSEDLQCLIRALMRRYCPTGREAQYSFELMGRSWESGKESVTEYSNELAKLARKAYPESGIPEKIMIDLFKKGLSLNMQMQVHLRHPQTMDDALATAIAIEPYEKQQGLGNGKKPRREDIAVISDPTPKPKNGPKNGPPNTPVTQIAPTSPTTELLKQLQALLKTSVPQQVNTTPTKDPNAFPDVQCYYCKENGHYKGDCPKLLAKKARDMAIAMDIENKTENRSPQNPLN